MPDEGSAVRLRSFGYPILRAFCEGWDRGNLTKGGRLTSVALFLCDRLESTGCEIVSHTNCYVIENGRFTKTSPKSRFAHPSARGRFVRVCHQRPAHPIDAPTVADALVLELLPRRYKTGTVLYPYPGLPGIFTTVVGVSENSGNSGIAKQIGNVQTGLGVAVIALGIAHVLPGVGQVVAAASVLLDVVNLGVELSKCP